MKTKSRLNGSLFGSFFRWFVKINQRINELTNQRINESTSQRVNEHGAVLITAVIILVFISVLGMSSIAFLYSRISYSQIQLDRLKALYLAEAGIYKALWELRFDIDPDGNGRGNISRTKLGDGEFWVRHDFQTATLTSTGEVNRLRRRMQIKYNAI